MHVANNALFIDMASLLWCASIEPELDPATKQPILPGRNDFVDEGLVVRPTPFKCKIVPRAPDIEAALEMVKDRLGDVI
jgi:hypothetical protein